MYKRNKKKPPYKPGDFFIKSLYGGAVFSVFQERISI